MPGAEPGIQYKCWNASVKEARIAGFGCPGKSRLVLRPEVECSCPCIFAWGHNPKQHLICKVSAEPWRPRNPKRPCGLLIRFRFGLMAESGACPLPAYNLPPPGQSPSRNGTVSPLRRLPFVNAREVPCRHSQTDTTCSLGLRALVPSWGYCSPPPRGCHSKPPRQR